MMPINKVIPQILSALATHGRVVVTAPTGSGKTTVVPQAILDAGLAEGKIFVVQPRRIAARSVASHVAQLRGVALGDEVGYWVRFDQRAHAGTKITYMTDGILLRLLQEDPYLHGVSVVIFDEFHERTLFSDTSLALVKSLCAKVRPDLRIVVMSATINTRSLCRYLSAPAVILDERGYPVDIRYMPSASVEDVVRLIVEENIPGNILVFQPGKAEIADCIESLRSIDGLYLLPLHGELPDEEQDRVFAPPPPGLRKVVVATNVAETSITIPDIQIVIDTGTEKVSEYDHETGIGGLFLHPISRASAEQRAGRAGRTGPGVCFRLWSEREHEKRPNMRPPEILRTSLAGVVLILKSMGVHDIASLDFLDNPGPDRIRSAEETLYVLGALDKDGNLTPVGWQMRLLPVEPHLARMLVEAARLGCLSECCTIAAVGSVRPILLRPKDKEAEADRAHREFREVGEKYLSDLMTLVAAYDAARQADFSPEFCREKFLNRRALLEAHEIRAQLMDIARQAGMEISTGTIEAVRQAIAAGYIDELWENHFGWYLRDEQEAAIARESVLYYSMPRWVIATNVRQVETRRGILTLITQATKVEPKMLCSLAPHLVEVQYKNHRTFVRAEEGNEYLYVLADEVVFLRGTEISRQSVTYTDPDAGKIIAKDIVSRRVSCPAADSVLRAMREVESLRHRNPDLLPPLSETALIEWYERKLGQVSSVPVSEVPVVDDDSLSEILGVDYPAIRESILAQYPEQVIVRGYEILIVYANRRATVIVPRELVDSLVWEDIPPLPGCTVEFMHNWERADSPDALRVRLAMLPVPISLPADLQRIELLSPVVVTHPGGKIERLGWRTLTRKFDGVYTDVAETEEEAEQKFRQTLTEELVRTLPAVRDVPQKLAQEINAIRKSIAWEKLDEIDLRQIGNYWEGLVESIKSADPAESLVERYRDLNDRIGTMEMQMRELWKQGNLLTFDETSLLVGMLEKTKAALNTGSLNEAIAHADELSITLSNIRQLYAERSAIMEQMQKRVRNLMKTWEKIAAEYEAYGLTEEVVRQARSEIDDVYRSLREPWNDDRVKRMQEKLAELERCTERVHAARAQPIGAIVQPCFPSDREGKQAVVGTVSC